MGLYGTEEGLSLTMPRVARSLWLIRGWIIDRCLSLIDHAQGEGQIVAPQRLVSGHTMDAKGLPTHFATHGAFDVRSPKTPENALLPPCSRADALFGHGCCRERHRIVGSGHPRLSRRRLLVLIGLIVAECDRGTQQPTGGHRYVGGGYRSYGRSRRQVVGRSSRTGRTAQPEARP